MIKNGIFQEECYIMMSSTLTCCCWWRWLPSPPASAFSPPPGPGFTGGVKVSVHGLMKSCQVFSVLSLLLGQILWATIAVLSRPPSPPLLLLTAGVMLIWGCRPGNREIMNLRVRPRKNDHHSKHPVNQLCNPSIAYWFMLVKALCLGFSQRSSRNFR